MAADSTSEDHNEWIIDSVLRSQNKKPLLGYPLSSALYLLSRRALLRYLRSKQHESTSDSSTHPDWASLPFDLLLSICRRLVLPDCVRLRSVCTSWASLPVKDLSALRIPWLAMMQRFNDRRIFFQSLSERRSYDTPFLHEGIHVEHLECVGYRDGWLVIVFVDLEVYLFNPLTLQRIRLPSFNTVHGPNKVIHFGRIGRVVLSPLPSADRGFTAVLVYKFKYLAFTRAGDDVWTKLYFHLKLCQSEDYPWLREREAIDDVVCHEEKLFVICNSSRFLAFDLSTSPPTKVLDFADRKAGGNVYSRQLVPCPSGRLLQMVHRYCEPSTSFSILEFVPEMASNSCWLEVEGSGADLCFFIDCHGCIAVCNGEAELGGMKRNCIYYVIPVDNVVRVYDMKTKGDTTLFPPDFQFNGVSSLPLCWFIPSLS